MKIIFRLISILFFFLILFFVIAYARGYRIDLKSPNLRSTGILVVSSTPRAAKVFVNGKLEGVTDLNLTLNPGSYTVEIKKDGYTSLTKQIVLKGELVLSIDALLFPINPTLSPLTNLGLVKAVPLATSDKILLFSETGDEIKDGIYMFDAGKKTLSFFAQLKTIILKKDLPIDLNLKDTNVYFSSDFKQLIVEFSQEKKSFLFSLEDENRSPFDVTSSQKTLLEAWDKERSLEKSKIVELFPKEITKIASHSFQIISFSQDETKLLYQAKVLANLPPIISPPLIAANQTKENRELRKNSVYVYDKKEDKNFRMTNFKLDTSNIDAFDLSRLPQWFPDSKHISFIDGKKISIVDYDGENRQTIYSGPFDNSFFYLTSDGKLLIMANLNPEENKYPDLYSIGIN